MKITASITRRLAVAAFAILGLMTMLAAAGVISSEQLASPATSSRMGAVSVANQTLTLKQAAVSVSTIQFSLANYTAGEGDGSARITVTRTGDVSSAATVDYATSDNTAFQRTDYTFAAGTLKFVAGESSESFSVLLTDDSYSQGARSLNVVLSNPTGASLGSPSLTTLTILDNDSVAATNPLDGSSGAFFVRQHYHDFLDREPDDAGLTFWTNNITVCAPQPGCIEPQRINTSAAFFLSIEFQNTGYLIERFYKTAFGDASGNSTFNGSHTLLVPIVRLNEFLPDAQQIGNGVVVGQSGWETVLENNKQAFAADFVQRARFMSSLPITMTPAEFVDKLNQNAGNVLSSTDRSNIIVLFGSATDTSNTSARAQALRQVAENQNLVNAEFNRAFVLMQYIGYLRRNPNDPQDADYTGYDFWLTKLNQFNGNFIQAEMVKAFINSTEYRSRFGPPDPTPTPTPTPTPNSTPTPTPTPTPPTGGTPRAVVVSKPWVFFTSKGQTTQLTAQAVDAQGSPVQAAITWTSSAPDRISVDGSGLLTANAIGSAQIFAASGNLQSTPTLVAVAEPKTGAVLVTDAQVISVGPPLNLAPGEAPGVGTQYEVTLQDVAPPAIGVVMLAAETAPIAGKVVATRQDSPGLVVTLAIAPIYQLFNAYDINYQIDLSAFPLEAVPEQSSSPSLGEMWTKQQRTISAVQPLANDPITEFKAFDCDGKIKPQLVSSTIGVSLDNQLKLELADDPGHAKQALTGSFALTGSAGVKLAAGFKASGRCDAQAKIGLPIFGAASVVVMPAVRVGLGAQLDGQITIVQGELGVEGKVGVSGVIGWECGGATPDCRSLNNVTGINELKTKSKIPSDHDMQAKVSAQFFALMKLDVGFANAQFLLGILEARIGPKQSFDLAFEKDQAARTDYASTYDLKLEGVVEPGAGLTKIIKLLIDDDVVEAKFQIQLGPIDISESPKGTHTVDKAKVRPNEKVQFTVSLDPKTLEYFLLGYNVVGLELWRKRDDESDFTRWKAMNQNASNQWQLEWTPTSDDVGKYQFAAFVNTQVLTPLLEVAPNSIQNVEVLCFSAPGKAIGTQASVCKDQWTGTDTITTNWPGVANGIMTITSNITWDFDHLETFLSQTNLYYKPSGTFDVKFKVPGCTVDASPSSFTIDPAAPNFFGQMTITSDSSFPQLSQYSIAGQQQLNIKTTMTCDGQTTTTDGALFVPFGIGHGPWTPGQVELSGTDDVAGSTWIFSRP